MCAQGGVWVYAKVHVEKVGQKQFNLIGLQEK